MTFSIFSICQQCQSPLSFDHLKEINTATFNLLTGANEDKKHDYEEINTIPLLFPESREIYYYQALESLSDTSKEMLMANNMKKTFEFKQKINTETHHSDCEQNLTSFFNTLSHSLFKELNDQTDNQEKKSDQLHTFQRLFYIMSSRSNINHPVCAECAETLLETMSKQLHYSKKERDAYIGFLNHIDDEILDDSEIEKIEIEIQENLIKETNAIETINLIKKEREKIKEEIKQLEKESLILDKEEEMFWRERNSFLLKFEEFQNERDAINLQYDYNMKRFEELQKTNVYNDVFCISHNGHFGTINNLRLGRLPSHTIGWDEINAAWGLTVLLLHSIANKLNFEFTGYKLCPLGSTSKINRIEFHGNSSQPPKVTQLELHSSDDLSVTRFFVHRKFDAAMVGFLECLRQIGDYLEAKNTQFKLPYKIHKDKIGDTSIYISFNQDEIWTRALKYLLTNAKYILAFISPSPT